jgi:hypothetical protein|nr:MAG TPA: hypothetical protein [Caudoviricetes sp.]
MNVLDFTKEEITCVTRNPAPIYTHLSSEKYLHEKYILKSNMNIEGIFNVKIKIKDRERIVSSAEVTTIDNHTVITRYI